MAEGQSEINEYFGTNVINQRALLQAQIDFAEATPDGRNKYRIRATNVPVEIWINGKLAKTVKINQRLDSNNGFATLGKYTLPAGRKTSVTVSNKGTDGYVVADGVQFVPVK